MKKLLHILILIAIAGTSCEDNFLDLSPVSQANANNFYQNEQQISRAVSATYAGLQLIYDRYFMFGEVRSDNTTVTLGGGTGQPQADIDEFTVEAPNEEVSNLWQNSYITISRANIVLSRIDGIEMDESLQSQYMGEMLFVRSLAYFNMVRVFGGVPLVLNEVTTPEEGFEHRRNTTVEVYEQIEQDLDEILTANLLPAQYEASSLGRATSYAAQALLAKVYLAQGKKAEAVPLLEIIINSGEFTLLEDYAAVFNPGNNNNREIVFAIQYTGGGIGTGSPFNNTFAPRNSGTFVSRAGVGDGENVPTESLLENGYEEGDNRFDKSIRLGYANAEGEFVEAPFTTKFIDDGIILENDGNNNWPVVRYSDVLLMYAEAVGESEPAYDAINQVRLRAGLDPINAASPGSFTDKLLQERRAEFAFEGHRWFDLIRLNQVVPAMAAVGIDVEEYQLLFPIPQTQMDVNPDALKQNPGY